MRDQISNALPEGCRGVAVRQLEHRPGRRPGRKIRELDSAVHVGCAVVTRFSPRPCVPVRDHSNGGDEHRPAWRASSSAVEIRTSSRVLRAKRR